MMVTVPFAYHLCVKNPRHKLDIWGNQHCVFMSRYTSSRVLNYMMVTAPFAYRLCVKNPRHKLDIWGNQHCVFMSRYTSSRVAELYDGDCTFRIPFVCEKSAA